MTAPFDFPREAWISIADELSGDPAFLADADPEWVDAARSFASTYGVPFPPPADVDVALELIAPRCDRCGERFRDRDELAEVVERSSWISSPAEVDLRAHLTIHVGCMADSDVLA